MKSVLFPLSSPELRAPPNAPTANPGLFSAHGQWSRCRGATTGFREESAFNLVPLLRNRRICFKFTSEQQEETEPGVLLHSANTVLFFLGIHLEKTALWWLQHSLCVSVYLQCTLTETGMQ